MKSLKVDMKTSAGIVLPLLQKVRTDGIVPADWKKGHLVKLSKKEDLGQYKNWRGIMILSVPIKILPKIILERFKDAIGEQRFHLTVKPEYMSLCDCFLCQ